MKWISGAAALLIILFTGCQTVQTVLFVEYEAKVYTHPSHPDVIKSGVKVTTNWKSNG